MDLGYITNGLPTPGIVSPTSYLERAITSELLPPTTPSGVALTANSQVPQNVTMVMPSLTAQAANQATVDQASHPAPLVPGDLNRPLPNIVTTEPVSVAAPCSGMTAWINDNPMLAVGLLGVLAYFMLGKKGN